MNHPVYPVGDTYPNLEGILSYAGPVNTKDMTAVLKVGSTESGAPFTGPVTRVSGDSLHAASSTFRWVYDVKSSDTTVEASYDIKLKITHADGSIETVDATTVVVEN